MYMQIKATATAPVMTQHYVGSCYLRLGFGGANVLTRFCPLVNRRSDVCTIIECIQRKAGQILGQFVSSLWIQRHFQDTDY